MRKNDRNLLLERFAALNGRGQSALLDYAAFLVERHPCVQAEVPREPLAIERPLDESVMAALKRLRATYPMLDPDTVLHNASALVTRHLVQGAPAAAVIDELELLFSESYLALARQPEGAV